MKDEGLKQSDREDAVPSKGTCTAVPLSLRGLSMCGSCAFVPSWSGILVRKLYHGATSGLGMDRRERQVLLAVL